MDFQGLRPEDFLRFLDSDLEARVEYIRDELHPRLRDLGHQLAEELRKRMQIELHPQLRSGRWFKHPWGTWVTLILPDEKVRSDNKRPRLCVYVDEHHAAVGFMQSVWQRRWKSLVRQPAGLEKAVNGTTRGTPKLQLALTHWAKQADGTWDRSTTRFRTAKDLLAAAAQWGQDFVTVGRIYPFPPEADLLLSPRFAPTAADVLQKAWPVYRYAFEGTHAD
jgi:hypothetical protein